MKKLYLLIITALLLSSCSDITNPGIENNNNTNATSNDDNTSQTKTTSALQTDSDVWVGAYLASYSHYVEPTGNWGNLPTEEIDWSAFTHLFYFSMKANADGSLSTIKAYENMSPDRINAIISAAHKAGKPVLFTIGGWGNYDGFSNAIKPANRAVFISNIVATLQQWGFDGVDLDMEPIRSGDADNYIAFINELNTALQGVSVPQVSEPLISVVTNWHPDIFAKIHDKVDQINLMTYDFSGAWEGWVTWHNAAVYSGGLSFPSNGKQLPSIDGKVKAFIDAGVPASKIGIGIDFYGYVWSSGTGTSTGGATEPNQSWDTAPTVTDNVAYHDIMDQYYQSDNYRWDDQAKAAYLSIDNSGSSNDKFISYDDEKSIKAKFDYARQNGLGGTIIWELAGGYRENQSAGERDNLLQAVKNEMNNGNGGGSSEPTLDTSNPNISFNTPADGAKLSGTTDIDMQASDNVGVSNVELFIDGTLVNSFSSAPYTYSWNTTDHANHNCTIEAKAVDAAGNSSTSTLSVTIDNKNSTDTGDSGSSSDELNVYEESLNTNWNNASWNATIDFNSTEQSQSGSRSVKVSQNSWGALSLRSGDWGQAQDVDPAQYEAIEIAVYSSSQDAEVSLMLENDQGQKFPRVSYGTVSANQWTTIRIPMNELNPDGLIFHRIDILETSGTSKTYFVDDIKLAGNGTGSDSDSDDSGSGTEDSDSGDSTSPDPGTETYKNVYAEQLENPWVNTSWNATVDFNNTERAAGGSKSIRVNQNAWGALSLHSGNWGQSQDVDPAQYEAVEIAVYPSSQDAEVSLMLENDQGQKFPRVSHGTVSANQWTTIRIPINELNPDGLIFHRIDILETSGAKKTYYIDNLRFVE